MDMCFFAKASMSFSLTLHNRSLKLNVLVAESFLSFACNGINRTKGVMPYNLFGDFFCLNTPNVDSMISEEILCAS